MSQIQLIKAMIEEAMEGSLEHRVAVMNDIRMHIHSLSPFKSEPVDCVLWTKNTQVHANDYNPNSVAPPEMQLLAVSIMEDGYTQPIVAWPKDDKFEIVDGFHRHHVGKECSDVATRVHGYLPIASINTEKTGKADRIASTIRHNRARGKHSVDAMSEIVLELKNRNWKNSRIARELGMDEDEILRLCQISGLETMFSSENFSKAWLIEDIEGDVEQLTDEIDDPLVFRTANTSDPSRIFHTFDKWECQKAGFYLSTKEGMSKDECEAAYAQFLSNDEKFREALEGVISNWKHSCEHYLTNKAMNRIAWLGQASLCYALGIPSVYRGGFFLLSPEQQKRADKTALEYLNKWFERNGREPISYESALSVGRQVEIY